MKPRLRVATRNAGKLREIQEILGPAGYEIVGIDDLVGLDVEESAPDFAGNALLKARAVVEVTGEPAIADDSGLEVEALGGAPGVRSARYAGVEGPGADEANRRAVLEALRGVPLVARGARFVCAVVYVEPGRSPLVAHGILPGRITVEPRGRSGFGYDPIFELPERGSTLAELTRAEKNATSHRRRALDALLRMLDAR